MHNPMWRIGLLLCCSACTQTTLTRVGPPRPSRDAQCEFDVLTARPPGGFIEVGTIDLTGPPPTNLGRFKEFIQEDVCRSGGDAALALANGHGYWIKATVLQRVADPPNAAGGAGIARPTAPPPTGATPTSSPPTAWEPPPTNSSAKPPKAPAPAGCQYDTQCKGDRICVQGSCRSPAPKSDKPQMGY